VIISAGPATPQRFLKPEAAKRFTALADAERMGFDEFLEHMLDVHDEASRKTEAL
jgi:hypothetical protein